MFKKLAAIRRYFLEDIWRVRLGTHPEGKTFWQRQLRILVLSLLEFNRDKCMLRASALTFYTLLSIVPIIAMGFGIAKGFGLKDVLESRIEEYFRGQEQVINLLIGFSNNFLENTRGGVVAGFGVVLLIWAIIKGLSNIEHSLNDIWGIVRHRNYLQKLRDYLSFMLICPFLLIIASSATVAVSGLVASWLDRIESLRLLTGPIYFVLRLAPLIVLSALFSFMYLFLPNGRVELKSGLLGGVLAGVLYHLTQAAFIWFQVKATSYGAIYGSFAALPLFLIWVQLSWLIVLFGAEFAFANQYVETYEYEQDCNRISRHFRRLVALAISHRCIRSFTDERIGPTASELSHELDCPIRLVNMLLQDLVNCGLLSEVNSGDEENPRFQPALPVHELRIRDVLRRLDHSGTDSIPVARTPSIERIGRALSRFEEVLAADEENLLVREI